MKQLAQSTVPENSSPNAVLSESLIEILDANILVLTHRNIDLLIKKWSEDGENPETFKEAISYLYRAVNNSRDEFTSILEPFNASEDSGVKLSCRVLNAISRHSTGNIHPNDILYKQCAQVSDLASNPKRMQLVGDYLKDAANSYLKENYSEMYEEVKNEFSLERLGFEMAAVNDSGALKDTSGFSATKAVQLCKKDLESSRDLKK